MDAAWYVLRSKPHKEIALWRELTARGVDCFYPKLHIKPVNPRSRKIRPFFPGYMFLHVNIEEAGGSLFQWIPFSSGLVSFDGVAATVPESIVHAIRRHVDAMNDVVGSHNILTLEPGELVRIHGGILDGYDAILDARLPGSERVRVLLKLLQERQMSVVLSADQIERLQQKRK